jgi:hypothetical protein
VSNGSVTPREEGFAKQTQVMLLGRWLSDDVASRLIGIGVKLEPWLRSYSWKNRKKGILHTKKCGKVWKPQEKVKVPTYRILVCTLGCVHACTEF